MEDLLERLNKALANNDRERLYDILDILVEQDNAAGIYKFYLYTNILNKDMINTLIRVGDPKYIYLIAYYGHGKYLDELTNAIIDVRDPFYLYLFITEIANVDVDRLCEALVETDNITYMYKLALERPDTIRIMADALIRKGHSSCIINFATFFSKAPVDLLIDEIVKRDNIDDIFNLYLLLKDKRNYNSKSLLDNIFEKGTGLNIYLLALDSQKVNDRIINALVKREDAFHLFNLILRVPDAPVERILEALKQLNYKFTQEMLEVILDSDTTLTNKLKATVWFDYNYNIRVRREGYNTVEILNILVAELKLKGDDKSVFEAIETLKGKRQSITTHQLKIKKFLNNDQ